MTTANSNDGQDDDAAPLSSSSSEKIKTMQLYTRMDRVRRELSARGLSDSTDPEALSAVDSLHYGGDEAIRDGVKALHPSFLAKMASNDDDDDNDDKKGRCYRILDIGSGLGGPARLMAKWIGDDAAAAAAAAGSNKNFSCHVTALELQADLDEVACQLTKQCGLDDVVEHVQGDFMTLSQDNGDGGNNGYDAITSWLVFLHISDKAELLQRCRTRLQPDSLLYVADFFQGDDDKDDEPWTAAQVESLRSDVFCQADTLLTATAYQTQLARAGFVVEQWTDMTETWKAHVTARHHTYQASMERHVQVHGKEAAASLGLFYQAMHELFQKSKLRGVTYLARAARAQGEE